jgi:hypothetical protein
MSPLVYSPQLTGHTHCGLNLPADVRSLPVATFGELDDMSDPFGINCMADVMNSVLMSAGFLPVFKNSMTMAFDCLRADAAVRRFHDDLFRAK